MAHSQIMRRRWVSLLLLLTLPLLLAGCSAQHYSASGYDRIVYCFGICWWYDKKWEIDVKVDGEIKEVLVE